MSLERLKTINTSDQEWKTRLMNLVDRISSLVPQSQIFVFGSFVRDQFTSGSDIDLAVILPDSWKVKDFLDQLYLMGTLSNWPIDLVVFRSTEFNQKKEIGGVCFDIAEDGIELYPKWNIEHRFK